MICDVGLCFVVVVVMVVSWIVFVYSGGDVVWITYRIIGLIRWHKVGELG